MTTLRTLAVLLGLGAAMLAAMAAFPAPVTPPWATCPPARRSATSSIDGGAAARSPRAERLYVYRGA